MTRNLLDFALGLQAQALLRRPLIDIESDPTPHLFSAVLELGATIRLGFPQIPWPLADALLDHHCSFALACARAAAAAGARLAPIPLAHTLRHRCLFPFSAAQRTERTTAPPSPESPIDALSATLNALDSLRKKLDLASAARATLAHLELCLLLYPDLAPQDRSELRHNSSGDTDPLSRPLENPFTVSEPASPPSRGSHP